MQNVLLVIHLMVAIALIAVVLMQRTAQDGGGLVGGGGGGTMGGLFTARGSANLLTRTTSILATLFIVLSLAQGIMAAHRHTTVSLSDQVAEEKAALPSSDGNAQPTTSTTPPAVPMSK